ncbi:exported hypothetical protein [Vibrio crassostreae]|uniref:Uncharacterized protein n=1 Tax=Vibrio crassostreae TaxID=246167 RepID=A0ABM9QLM7_9VIBR|nr:hypothetical protein [Vibrio crassostreae]TCL22118.1 hypothetical protein EDB52_11118 [Vibrio crassostreae]TCN97942.1 hypothetical protein EDB30_115121 [Vibrio crassostreae]TCT44822.1 hypothetical protein EDB39_1233 [Vibrio crassostreae]TCT47430.1 hypothetical protein EDB42_11672 [Vibrio crassostreae]TCT52429.1 hypothetical protein EDB40_11618 [Vibrio crassostreae]
MILNYKKKKISINSLLWVILLSACSESASTTSTDSTGSEDNAENVLPLPEPVTYSSDGFFLSDHALLWMLVDTKRDKEGIIIGLFRWDSFYVTDSHSWENEQSLTTQGLTYETTDWQGSRLFDYGSNLMSNITFFDDFKEVSITARTQYYVFNESFTNKTPALIELSEVTGTHTNSDDGSTWYLQEDGYFIFNGECTISGIASKSDFYYNVVNVEATSCSDLTKNGADYNGIVVAFNYKGKRYLNGLFKNSSAILQANVTVN